MNTQANTEVQHYLDAMRGALADLPAAEVGEIMDDAGAHVVEVAEEMGDEFTLAALIDRLGTPQAYAQELRAAAGYPPPAPATPAGIGPVLLARFTLWSLVAGTLMAFAYAASRGDSEELTVLVGLCAAAGTLLVFRRKDLLAAIGRLPEAVALRDVLRRAERSEPLRFFTPLRTFQPMWWVARALLIIAVGMLAYRLRSPIVLVVVTLAFLSLVAGPKAKTDRRWLWISLPSTGLAIGGLLLVFGSMTSWLFYERSAPVSYNTAPPSVPDNIYVFDKDGKPLTDVHLYDEDGRPLDSSWYGCDGRTAREDNRYPRPRVVRDENGCREIPGVPPFTIVIPGADPAVTTTAPPTAPPTAPSTTPSPQPTTAPPATQSVPPTAVVPTS